MRNLLCRSACSFVFIVWAFAGTQSVLADELAGKSTVVVVKATAAGVALALPKGMIKDVQATAVPEPTALFLAGLAGCMLLVLAQRLRASQHARAN